MNVCTCATAFRAASTSRTPLSRLPVPLTVTKQQNSQATSSSRARISSSRSNRQSDARPVALFHTSRRVSAELENASEEAGKKAILKKPIPEPRGSISSPSAFLSSIDPTKKRNLASYESKFPTWEDLFRADGAKLKEEGVGTKERRYLLNMIEKYRQGHDPAEVAIKPKPRKKIRGWGPKVQKGKRIK